jgi:hypothetical protein
MPKTTCSVCKKDKFANPKAYEARIAKFGSLEEVAKQWICSECKPTKEKTEVPVTPDAAEENLPVPEPEIIPEQ